MSDISCSVFGGTQLSSLWISFVSLLMYVLCFMIIWNCCVYFQERRAARSGLVFAMDLGKIFLAFFYSWLFGSSRTIISDQEAIPDPLSRYFVVSSFEFVLGTFIALGLGKLICYMFRRWDQTRPSYRSAFFTPLHHFGKYFDERYSLDDRQVLHMLTHSNEIESTNQQRAFNQPRFYFWAIQLICWVLCISIGFLISGYISQVSFLNPFYPIAIPIHQSQLDCTTRTWVFIIIIRILIEMFLIGITDYSNQFGLDKMEENERIALKRLKNLSQWQIQSDSSLHSNNSNDSFEEVLHDQGMVF
eukprot:c17987_g1_i2.p1 GENE.c17987_g1_i2~~c17987_g1_i2.p1  ORF type:complete len:303 (+),score=102.82 c17987_g1_i2:97-1005(+)